MSEDGVHWLIDSVDKVVMGDQYHAQAVEALREARGKSWTLLVESEEESGPNEGKPYATLYGASPQASDGHILNRMATYLHNAAHRYMEVAQSARARFMMAQLMGLAEADAEDESQ